MKNRISRWGTGWVASLLLWSVLGCVGCGVPASVVEKDIATSASVKSSFQAGDPVVVKFEVTNGGTQEVFLLMRHTPFEGIRNSFLEATRDGKALEYRGIMAKRGDPGKDNYLALRPGQSSSREVVLSDSYDLTEPGEYRFTFSGLWMDFGTSEASIPKKPASFVTLKTKSVTFTFSVR